jgi:hypothetical protein
MTSWRASAIAYSMRCTSYGATMALLPVARPRRRPHPAGRARAASAARAADRTRDAITGFVTANPRATAADIATGTGIARSVVYSATSRLAASGRLRRVSTAERQVGFELGGDAAAPEPPAAAAPALDAGGSHAPRGLAPDETPGVPEGATRPAGQPARAGTPNARGAATAAPAPAGGRTRAKRGGRRAAGRKKPAAAGRAPRGANRAAVLAVIAERPGVSARELAAASRVTGGTLYALLRTLTERGEIDKQQLPSGYTGYRLGMSATTAAPPPVPLAPIDSGATPPPSAAPSGDETPDDAGDST